MADLRPLRAKFLANALFGRLFDCLFDLRWEDRADDHRGHGRGVDDPASFVRKNRSECSPGDEQQCAEEEAFRNPLEAGIFGSSREPQRSDCYEWNNPGIATRQHFEPVRCMHLFGFLANQAFE